jgi:hypothetical protein
MHAENPQRRESAEALDPALLVDLDLEGGGLDGQPGHRLHRSLTATIQPAPV